MDQCRAMEQTVNDYVPSVVTYLDILGFQQMVDSRPCDEIASILQLLQSHTRPTESDESLWHYSFKSFSDLVVRSFPLCGGGEQGPLENNVFEGVFAEIG